jgi:DNA-binding MarR family transcriptional regulator
MLLGFIMRSQEIQEIREFNRFYTNIIGLLDRHLLSSAFTLPEARILYELYQHQPCTASRLLAILKIDKGYLSRIVAQFEKKGLVTKRQSKEDARAAQLTLTAKGNQQFEKINEASIKQIQNMVTPLSTDQKKELLQHMHAIQDILKSFQ